MVKVIKKNWVIFVSAFLVILLVVLFWQRENIAENKFAKAKMEFFNAAANKDSAKMKEAIDSMKNYISK